MDAQIRPPLIKRLRPPHWTALDWVAALLFAVPLLSLLRTSHAIGAAPYPLLAVLAMAICLPVALRRRRPVAALGALLATSVALAPVSMHASLLLFGPAAYVLYLLVTGCPHRTAAGACAVTVTCLTGEALTGGLLRPQPSGEVLAAGFSVVMAWAIGYAVRQQRTYTAQLRRQMADQVATAERLRIARELHDVVAHSMSVIAVQAGVGYHVIETQPAQARAALGAIETVSRDTLVEIRSVLGRLRRTEPGSPFERVPAPSLANLDRLTALTAQAGVQVDLRVHGGRRDLPAAIDQSAFRIVQEALTNVIKHARTSRCQVCIGHADAELSIEVTDHGDAGEYDGPGHGLSGIRERVQMHQGQFSAGPLPGGGFRVTARLPLDTDAT